MGRDYGDGGIDALHVGLLDEEFSRLLAEGLDLVLLYADAVSQLLDVLIQLGLGRHLV